MQTNGKELENVKINPCIYIQNIFDKVEKKYTVGKHCQQMRLGKLDS